jgi:hypothetical protein
LELNVKTALARINVLSSAAIEPGVAPQKPLRETRAAADKGRGATSGTAVDHAQLASYCQTKGEETHKKLTVAEYPASHWSWAANRTKLANACTYAWRVLDGYRAELETTSELAAANRKIRAVSATGIETRSSGENSRLSPAPTELWRRF